MPRIQRELRPSIRAGRVRGRGSVNDISNLQRARLIAATIKVVEADGYAGLTVARVIARSRVSRKTFYDLFSDSEDCFLAAFEQTLLEAREIVAGAYAAQSDQREGTRAAVLELLSLIEGNPGAARLCIVEALAAGQRVLDSRARALQEVAHAVDRMREQAKPAEDPLIASAVAGGIAAMLHAHLTSEADQPANLPGVLMAMIVLPYLGRGAACEELARPVPERTAPVPGLTREVNPLQALKLRLTYRTIRVLIAIAEQPGASNRQIAQAADIVDQGQISKLLRRLKTLGLIENFGEGQPNGRANAWQLTELGADVQRVTGGR